MDGVPVVDSVNIAIANLHTVESLGRTGIAKAAQRGAIELDDPGPREGRGRSGVAGDFIGDGRHHGGSDQAVYAYAREDLDDWGARLGRQLSNGTFGENLTTRDLDVNDARIGERWRIGATAELAVTSPRIPCQTFNAWMNVPGWLKLFTAAARPGAYLRVLVAGPVSAHDRVEVVDRPSHNVSVSRVFRAMTLEPELLPSLLAAGPDLPDDIVALVHKRAGRELT